MSELDLLGLLSPGDPQGPAQGSDPRLVANANVYAVDAPGRMVQVGLYETAMWLPAVSGRYRVRLANVGGEPGRARVLLNPTTGRPELVLGPINPRNPAISGTLTALDTVGKRATVTVDGASYVLEYQASTYTVGAPVWVGLDDWGVPFLVQGPADVTVTSVAPPPPPDSATTVQVTQTIGPQWSGSWRSSRSAWDRWNTSSYGGRSTLYQGNGFGSGSMVGLATYGDQLTNLGAISIDRIQVALRSVGLSGASGPATVQGSPHGSQPGGAPSSSGDTTTGDGLVDLTASMREAMRTGSTKGLALVGGNYWAVAGAGNGDGMALTVTYTRPA